MSKIKHICFAYLILAIFLWLLAWLVITPVKVKMENHFLNSRALVSKINELESQRAGSQQILTHVQGEFEVLLSSNRLSTITRASEAGHEIQELVKPVFENQSATILQMRPDTIIVSEWFAQSRLEIGFRIAPEGLEPLLSGFAKVTPILHVELLSLRMPKLSNVKRATELEARIVISIWFMRESLEVYLDQFNMPIDVDVGEYVEHDDETNKRNGGPLTGSKPSSKLLGLFDATYRARIQNPSVQYYRLAAITVSKNDRVAVIADILSGETRRLRIGEILDGWKIQNIDVNGVTLLLGERKERLNLQKR